MEVDSNQKGIFVGFQTNNTGKAYPMLMVAKKTATPATKLCVHMNTTKQWKDLSSLYAHAGIVVDIDMP